MATTSRRGWISSSTSQLSFRSCAAFWPSWCPRPLGARARAATRQCRLQHPGVIDPRIVRRVQQRDRLALAELAKLGERRVSLELAGIAPTKGLKPLRVVVKPLAQRCAGGNILHP